MLCNDIGCAVVRVKDLFRNSIWSSGAKGVVVGVSGGVDSAVVLALAAKSLGPENVLGVSMPSLTNNPSDETDAKNLCEMFGVEFLSIPLGEIVDEAMRTKGFTDTVTLRGNFTARLRMATLYNIAAARSYLVAGTSNKTEYMIGYSTKWGDGAADIQPILHLWKKDVYLLSEELMIPKEIIEKQPSAGFWEGQSDEDEIGISYEKLDEALIHLEENSFVPENDLEEKVLQLIKNSQHKRVPAANLLFKS